jgi:triphosphoribosyl-dephospho-CoA synthase
MAARVLSGLRAKTESLSVSGDMNADKSMSVDDVLSPEDFDIYCLDKGINPGSVADIVIAGIFVALMEGWRWDCSAAE